MLNPDLNKNQPLRHRQIWIEPTFIDSVQNLNLFSQHEQEYITNWISKKKAFVGRSLATYNFVDSKIIPVGLMAYISDKSKKRLNLLIQKNSIQEIREPLLLQEVLDFLRGKQICEIEYLLNSFKEYPTTFRVYGSLFWSYQDKKNHMTENSDIDLLIQFNKFFDPLNLSQHLIKLSEKMSIRLDGEFEISKGTSVSWREFASNSQILLVKSDLGPCLKRRDEVLEQLYATFS